MPLSWNAKIAGFSLILALAAPAFACEAPDDGSAPLRGVITRVKYLAETEAWEKTLPPGRVPQFVLLVDSPRRIHGKCYWPVEVRAGGELWKRFLVSPDAKHVIRE